jgi:hypothetical protein
MFKVFLNSEFACRTQGCVAASAIDPSAAAKYLSRLASGAAAALRMTS